MRSHPLRGNVLGCLDLQAQCIPVERQRRRKIANGDADVIENGLHSDNRI
jgi:hypothetical protein